MKKLFPISFLFAILFALVFTSCTETDHGYNTNYTSFSNENFTCEIPEGWKNYVDEDGYLNFENDNSDSIIINTYPSFLFDPADFINELKKEYRSAGMEIVSSTDYSLVCKYSLLGSTAIMRVRIKRIDYSYFITLSTSDTEYEYSIKNVSDHILETIHLK